MTRAFWAAALLAASAGPLPMSARAQVPGADGHPMAIIAGAGGAFASSQPGIARNTGAAFVAGLEVAHLWQSGFARRFGFRFEGGLASQHLSSSSSLVTGDVQTVYAAALGTMGLQRAGRFQSYLVAGPVWGRPSTRLVLASPSSPTPGAAFAQTTHESVGGVLLGLGAGWRMRAATLRVEARWMSLATAQKSTQIVPVVLALSIPLPR
ncbi:MAG: hypothetical protein KGL93_05975 [Gemmatimonadota bacterium]|nr:hypothetical protein [Gemmatimonadota bacterium]